MELIPNPVDPGDETSQSIESDASHQASELQLASETSDNPNVESENQKTNQPNSSLQSALDQSSPTLTPTDSADSQPLSNSTMPSSSQEEQALSQTGSPDWTSELVQSLEAFGYGKDSVKGERKVTLRNLPDILQKFQDSRSTIYLSPEELENMRIVGSQNPDVAVESEMLISILQNAKEAKMGRNQDQPQTPDSSYNSKNVSRIRSADSPSSSNGENSASFFGTHSPTHTPSPTPSSGELNLNGPSPTSNRIQSSVVDEGDDSFDSTAERTLQATTDSEKNVPALGNTKNVGRHSKSSSSPVFLKGERHRSVPLGATRHERPMPPNRRKQRISVGSGNTFQSPCKDKTDSFDFMTNENLEDWHQQKPASQAHQPQLTASNISDVIFANRQRGLYSSTSDLHDGEQPQFPQPHSGVDSELLRRLRIGPKNFTRVFESGIGLDGFPTPSNPINDNTLLEEYMNLQRAYEILREKIKDLEEQISHIGKVHEDELVTLNDKLEEISQDLAISKKNEKDLSVAEKRQRFQLTNSDEEITRLQKELSNLQNNHVKTKQKCDEFLTELEKVRSQLSVKEEELRYANQSVQSHASDINKWEGERKFFEDLVKKLQGDLSEQQRNGEILEEQKQANLDLKATIDKLKFELDEQRARLSGSLGPSSRPISIAGSVRNTFGEEIKRAIASGEYGEDDDNASDTTEGDKITRIVKGLSDEISVNENDEVYEEIQIKRIKRKKAKDQTGQGGSDFFSLEEVIEIQDASTDCEGLISLKSVHTQTDTIPEPPPLYRPKMEDLQIQTEDLAPKVSSKTQSSKKDLEQLIQGVDLDVLKLALANISRGDANIEQLSEASEVHYIPQDPASDDQEEQGSASNKSLTSKMNYFRLWRSSVRGTSSLTNTIINVFPSINLNNQPPFGRPEFSLMNLSFRMCSSVLFLLSTGYFLGNLIFNSSSSPAYIVHLIRTASNDASLLNAFININSIAIGGEGLVIGYVGRSPSLLTRLADKGFK
ncbi:hypothetical protein PPACK8108_LOCUS157 [Phakopsora pachyrhizi]|uniref:Uncharacterized protein n=1 Tax=Phakopsora pachyrhizi TaxID=170000 RepID=A0AAV0AGT7_PHAPC|nr:hypothetical protein PPACK8108_LOCUS157 [Phakopsora pachyrhizi]